jgi:hypothetical protein
MWVSYTNTTFIRGIFIQELMRLIECLIRYNGLGIMVDRNKMHKLVIVKKFNGAKSLNVLGVS